MEQHEIVSAVRGDAGLTDEEHAGAATRATLAVLGERLGGQVPPWLVGVVPDGGTGTAFGVEEFYRRVADEEGRGCTADGAREHARAIVAAVKSRVSAGDFDELVARLPGDYRDDLLSTAPSTEHH